MTTPAPLPTPGLPKWVKGRSVGPKPTDWTKRPVWKPEHIPPVAITRALARATGEAIPTDLTPCEGIDWGERPPIQHMPTHTAQVGQPSPIGNFYAVSPWLTPTRQTTLLSNLSRLTWGRHPSSALVLLSATSEHRAFHTTTYSTALILSERLPLSEPGREFVTGEARPWMLLGFGEWADQRLFATALPGEFVVRVPRPLSTPPSFRKPDARFQAFHSAFRPSGRTAPF